MSSHTMLGANGSMSAPGGENPGGLPAACVRDRDGDRMCDPRLGPAGAA